MSFVIMKPKFLTVVNNYVICEIYCTISATGATRSHIDLFKAIRGARVDHFVVETNKLLIRLDKLLAPDAPTDPKRRKGLKA